MSNNSRRRRNSCSRPLKPLEQDIGKAIAHLEVKETKEAQEYSSRNTNPDEPHKVRKGEVIETEITQCEKAIKESILKNNEILNSLNDPDDVLAAKLTAPIEKFRKLQPEMSKLGKQRYATALERSQHHRKTRVDTTKAYFKKSWKDGLNESLMRMRSRYDFRKLSYDQKEQLFNALPILNAVEEGDADKLHIFLESKCVHYANGTTGKACPCVGLTTIFDKKRRDFVEGNILVFAGANLKYQFLEDLIIRLDTTKNQHLEMLMRNWLRDYDKILLEVLFYDSEHDGYDQNDQTMTLQVLTNRRYRTLTNFSCSYSHIFSYPHKNDYQCSSVDQSYLSYATSNKQWAVVADFLSNLGVDKACRELIPQFLVDLVYTKEAANIRRILTDFWVPWTNRLYEDKRETLSEADRKYLCFPTLIEQYGMKGANGETCFHAAVLVGNREILSTVLKTVKSVLSRFKCHELFLHEFTNMEGQTALDLAIALGQKEMAEALWEHMYRPEILTNSRLFDTVGDYANLLDGKKDLTGLVHRFIHSVLTRVQPDYNVRLDRINLAYGQTPMLTILVVLEEFDLAHTLLKYYGLMFKYGTDQYILDDLDGALTHFPRRSRNNDSKEEDEFIKKRLDLYACLLAAGARYHQLGSSFKILKDSHTQEDLVLFYNDFMANKKEAARTGITLNHVVPEVFEDAAGNLRLGFISP